MPIRRYRSAFDQNFEENFVRGVSKFLNEAGRKSRKASVTAVLTKGTRFGERRGSETEYRGAGVAKKAEEQIGPPGPPPIRHLFMRARVY